MEIFLQNKSHKSNVILVKNISYKICWKIRYAMIIGQ